MVVLHERLGDADLAVTLDLEGFDEETAGVAEDLGLDDEHPGQGGFDDLHATERSLSMRNRYWP